jgi:hypothetical protein
MIPTAQASGDHEAPVWHFVVSERSGTIGTHPRNLDRSDENGISYVIHLP